MTEKFGATSNESVNAALFRAERDLIVEFIVLAIRQPGKLDQPLRIELVQTASKLLQIVNRSENPAQQAEVLADFLERLVTRAAN